jgi:hypothetical protein
MIKAMGSIVLITAPALFIGCIDTMEGPSKNAESKKASEYVRTVKMDPATGDSLLFDQSTQEWNLLNPGRHLLGSDDIPKGLAKSSARVYRGAFSDWSNQVQIQIWECGASAYSAVCEVDPGEVLVGGGVSTSDNEVFITETRPTDFGLASWTGKNKCKSCQFPNFPFMYVYAIGMKIPGVSRGTLLDRMALVTATSAVSEAPGTAASAGSVGLKLIGGGAKTNYTCPDGNLLTGSDADLTVSQQWYVASKSHKVSCPASITAYAIGINPVIPGWGTLEIGQVFGSSAYQATGISTSTVSADAGWVITSPGGYSSYQSGSGRMLYELYPTGNSVLVRSCDNKTASAGYTRAFSLQARKKP